MLPEMRHPSSIVNVNAFIIYLFKILYPIKKRNAEKIIPDIVPSIMIGEKLLSFMANAIFPNTVIENEALLKS